jgi:hypothetical protein
LQNATVELYEITGKKLQDIKLAAPIAGGQTLSLPVHTSRLAKGSYLLICKSAGLLMVKQMIVIQ